MGVAFAVSIPLASAHHKSLEQESVSRLVEIESVCSGREHSGSSEDIKNQQVDFEKLGKRIFSQLNKQEICKDFPWKQELKTILEMGNNENSEYGYKVQQESYNGCSDSRPCGFLEIEKTGTRKQTLYKLKIESENLENQKVKGKVKIVKQGNNETPDYYEGYPKRETVSRPAGITINEVEGSSISSEEQEDMNNGWSKVPGYSIIKQTE